MRYLLTWILMAVAASIAIAQSPVVHAHLEPTGGVIVGEPVRLVVQILAPNYFTGSPDFPGFELENTIVVQPQERAENSSVKIHGTTYAGISETYFLYPQQPGDFKIPPVQFTVSYANRPPATTIAHVQMPSLTFHAELPAAAQGMDYFLPTTRLLLHEKWSKPLKNLRVGDTVERTATITAMKMQAMLIPPLPMNAPAGIRIYPEQASIQDQKTSTGEFVYGRRVERAQYFIQKEGDYTLPAIQLKWWNLAAKRMETATLPAVHFTAAPNPDLEAAIPPEKAPILAAPAPTVHWWVRYRRWIRAGSLTGLLVLLSFWICWKFLPTGIRFFRRKYRAWQISETASFHRLLHACRGNDPVSAYRRLLAWLTLAWPEFSVEEFIATENNAAISTEIEHLGAVLFSQHSHINWNGKGLATALKDVRAKKHRRSIKTKQLLPLNP